MEAMRTQHQLNEVSHVRLFAPRLDLARDAHVVRHLQLLRHPSPPPAPATWKTKLSFVSRGHLCQIQPINAMGGKNGAVDELRDVQGAGPSSMKPEVATTAA